MASIIKADTLQSTTSNVFVLNSAGTEYVRFDATVAEAARAAIRTKYATMQTAINSASTVDAIKAAMPQG